MPVAVRKAAENDIACLRPIAERSIYELCAGFYSQEELRAWLNQYPKEAVYKRWLETRMLVVAADGIQVLGFAQFDPGRGEIEAMHVLPASARRGIGTMLVTGIEERAKKAGFTRIAVEASVNAERFYRRCGYAKVLDKKFQCRDGAELDCVRLEKLFNDR